jgi:ribosomal protein S18 acetylase RimI-like enzyme
LSESDEVKFEKLEIILNGKDKQNNNNFLRSFLSMSGSEEMGDIIIVLGNKLSQSTSEKLFKKYSEIVDNVNKIVEFSRTNFTKEIQTNPELISKIEETLYVKGKNLLSQVYQDIKNKKETNFENIDRELDRINADTLTTFAIFKQAVKNGERLSIESIEGASFSKKEAGEINEEKQKEMLDLYEYNWRNHSDKKFVENLKEYFKSSFLPVSNQSKNKFYLFEKDDKIRAFVRFESKEDGSEYASALNVDEASKNFGLGEAMMDEALVREAQENILHASCRKDNPSNMRYLEKGFIAKGFKKTSDTEELDLIWDEKRNKNIISKQKSKEELIKMYETKNTGELKIKKENKPKDFFFILN